MWRQHVLRRPPKLNEDIKTTMRLECLLILSRSCLSRSYQDLSYKTKQKRSKNYRRNIAGIWCYIKKISKTFFYIYIFYQQKPKRIVQIGCKLSSQCLKTNVEKLGDLFSGSCIFIFKMHKSRSCNILLKVQLISFS